MNAVGKHLTFGGLLALVIFFQLTSAQAAPPLPVFEPHKSVITINQPTKTKNELEPPQKNTPPVGITPPASTQLKKTLPPAITKPLPRTTPTKPGTPPHPSTIPPVNDRGRVALPSLQKQLKNPALLSEIRQALFVEIITFDANQQPDRSWKWSARVKNNGSSMIEEGRLQAKVIQKLPSGTSIQAGTPLPPLKSLVSKEILSLNQAQWTKAPMTQQLIFELWDSKKNQLVASQNLSLPIFSGPVKKITNPAADHFAGTSLAEVTPNPIFDFQIVSAEYLGHGRFQTTIRNDGNIKIPANRLKIAGKYYIGTENPVVPRLIAQEILPGQTKVVEVAGLQGDGECFKLSSIDITVVDPDTGKDRYEDLRVTSLQDTVTITNADFGQGFFRLSLQNTAPYRVKLKTIITEIEIWDIAKSPEDDNGNILQQAWDLVTGGLEFDTSGLEPEELQCTARNILIAPLELSEGGTPQVSPTWFIPITAFQNAVRAQCPNANFSSYSQIFKNLSIQAYTENIDACTSRYALHTFDVSEGGRDTPIFSW